MLVVVDTNVLVSGVFWGGTPYRLLEHWMSGEIGVAVTRSVLDEYVRVLRELSDREPELARQWIDFIAADALVVEAAVEIEMCRDPEDNKFLICAVSADADYVVSGDSDLLTLREVEGIPIVTARGLLQKLRE